MVGVSEHDVSYTDWIEYPNARLRVVIDIESGTPTLFVVQLEYHLEGEWEPVVRFDHNSESQYGHDITEKGLTGGTIRAYYAYVSAFCGWAVCEGHLAENVARRRNATEPIPDDGEHKSGDQQACCFFSL